MLEQVNRWTKIGRKTKRLFSQRGRSQTQLTPTTSHESSTPSQASKSNASQHEQKLGKPTISSGAKPASLAEQDLTSSSKNSLMDRAIKKHRKDCARDTHCPCGSLDINDLEDGLHEIGVSSEANKPWIRERLQKLLPSLKAIEPWLDTIDAVAQVNPISGQVSGLVKVALKLAIVIGDQYGDVISSLQHVREILYLLALYERDGPPPDLAEDILQAYVDVFDFLCLESAHKHSRKDTEDRLAQSVQRLESKAAAETLNVVNKLVKFQTIAEMERKGDECMKEILDAGTQNEKSAHIDKPAERTCAWVYDCSDCSYLQPWRDWKDSKDSGIMLLTGGIGTGKSTLALNAIDALRNYPSSECRSVSASFCKYQADYNNFEAILRGLLYGIARDNREARDILLNHRDNSDPAKVGRNFNAFSSLDDLSSCFTKCVDIRKKELCLVVDGLDECEEISRGKLLSYFTKLVEGAKKAASSPPLKILFLSRPINTIIRLLGLSTKLDLREVRKSDETKRIIEHLVESETFQLDDLLRKQLVSLLEEKADGCIQWVRVVVDHLSKIGVNTFDSIKFELRELSDAEDGLDKMYLTLFGRHFDKSLMDYANTALRLVAGAARPLTVNELANAMIVNPLRSDIVSKEDFNKVPAYRLKRLEPFVRISSHSSRIFMHNSLRELISRTPHLGNPPPSLPDVNNLLPRPALSNLLATTCLDFLLLPYFRNEDVRKDFNLDEEEAGDWMMGIQIDLDDNGDVLSENDKDQAPEREEGPAFFAYATEHWAQHLSDADFSKPLIDKTTVLSEAGSMQCINWWQQYKSAKKVWEPEHMSPLLAAIYFGHEPTIKALLQDILLERSSNFCQNITVPSMGKNVVTYEMLTLAVRWAKLDTFELLHKAALDDELKSNGCWLLLSAISGKRPDIFETLVNDPRVELTHRYSLGRTILTEIARRGDIKSLRSLLGLLQTDRRSEIMALLHDTGDEEKCSPLWWAANWGHTEVAEALCSLGPDMIRPQLLCPGKFGDHVLGAAARGGDGRIMVALLKVCPEYINRRCAGTVTPLAMTKYNSDGKAEEVAEVLLATGLVDIDESGGAALRGAFAFSKMGLCKVLLRHGADLSNIIRVSEHEEPVCLAFTSFPELDVRMRDALLEYSHAMKLAI